MSRFVIGDPHGCYKTFLALIEQLPKDAQITVVGDLIDRGPDSRKIVQYVIDNRIDCVRGNHEEMTKDPHRCMHYRNGGLEFIKNYEGEPEVLEAHKKFLQNLPLYIEYPDCVREDGRYLVVSHSYASKVLSWDSFRKERLSSHFKEIILWGRNFQGSPTKNIFNVFGHTPQTPKSRIRSYFACIDTGAVFGGILTALQYPEMVLFEQELIDDSAYDLRKS